MATVWFWSYFYTFLPSKICWLQNPVCLTFCALTWSIFNVGWKVRWVSESKFRGLSDGYEKFLCMCSRSRKNGKKKVGPVIWDTLYIIYSDLLINFVYIIYSLLFNAIFWNKAGDCFIWLDIFCLSNLTLPVFYIFALNLSQASVELCSRTWHIDTSCELGKPGQDTEH